MSAQKAMAVLATEIDGNCLPDNQTHQFRMEIKSESSNRLYIVSKAKSSGQWQCACMGWIRWRKCKHLTAIKPALIAIDQKFKLIGCF